MRVWRACDHVCGAVKGTDRPQALSVLAGLLSVCSALRTVENNVKKRQNFHTAY